MDIDGLNAGAESLEMAESGDRLGEKWCEKLVEMEEF